MFLYIILVIFVMAASAVIIMKMTFWMISNLGHKYIEMTHKSAEYIINTGAVPPFWFKNKRSKENPFMAKLRCLKKTRKLIDYFKNNTISGDETTREIIVSKLTEIYNQWTEKEWEELKPPTL